MTALLLSAAVWLAYLAIPPTLPVPCPVVVQSVQLLGEDGATALALRQGWTAQQIAEARRVCLPALKPPTK